MGDVCGGSSSVSMVSGAVLHCLAKPSLLIILKDTIFLSFLCTMINYFILFYFVLFCFILFCFVLFCFVL
jgi:hypothetical protein